MKPFVLMKAIMKAFIMADCRAKWLLLSQFLTKYSFLSFYFEALNVYFFYCYYIFLKNISFFLKQSLFLMTLGRPERPKSAKWRPRKALLWYILWYELVKNLKKQKSGLFCHILSKLLMPKNPTFLKKSSKNLIYWLWCVRSATPGIICISIHNFLKPF